MIDLAARADAVAPLLLGSVLRCGHVGVRLTEVEAYLGRDDPASHAHRGPTPRSAVMFGPPGRIYVYLSYGVHLAANIVCGPEGEASACLLRGGEVVAGLDEARARRPRVSDRRLARGPGNLGRTLGIRLTDTGAALAGASSRFELTQRGEVPEIRTGPRIGITRATDLPLRFWIPGAIGVSGSRASQR